jgi:hypothetical protein
MVRRPWTKQETALLKRRYATTTARDLVALMGRSASGIYQRAIIMGLQKDPTFVAATARRLSSARTGAAAGHRFTPGQRPWNHGMKGLQMGGDSVRTQFQKGHRSGAAAANWVPIGSMRMLDGYLQRKVTDNGYAPRDWRSMHVMLWERYRGPIPPGHAVVFKDGDRSHIKIANLECISRRELMRRNSYHTNYPKEIARLIQLRGAVQRQINRRAHEKQDRAPA